MATLKRKPVSATPAAQVARRAKANGVRLARFMWTDNGGVTRFKATHIDHLEKRITDGIGLTKAMQAMNMMDQLATVDGLGPVGEIRLVPDPATFKILPWMPNVAAMTVDMLEHDGTPWAACPRSFLKRQIAAAAELGLSIQAVFEIEFSLAEKDDAGRYVPIDQALCFATTGATISEVVIDEMIATFEQMGMPVDQYYPELGHGQQELPIRHADALQAADNQVFYREVVRNVAYAYEMFASLAPKPWVDQAGNGAHIHFSLWDRAGRKNLMYDPKDPYGLSPIGYHFIAGVLAHLPGLLALTCPSVNSYRRLQPRFWSSAYTAWGPDNREAAVRVPSNYKSDPAGSTNAELKSSDSSANPYLSLGGLIAAGLDGVRRKLSPGEPALIDPGNWSDAERAARGIQRFPTTLKEALDNLAADQVLTDALGPLLATAYQAVKRLEQETFSANDTEFELRHHFWKF